MAGVCSECGKECVFKESKSDLCGFPCDICGIIYCKNCAELSTTEIRFVAMASRILPYLCKQCIGVFKEFPILKRRIEELEVEVKHLKEGVRSSKQSYADVIKLNTDHSEALKNTMQELERKVEVISKPENVPHNSETVQLEPTIQELQEREQRAAHILIFGVKESDKVARDERIESENKAVGTILRKISGNNDCQVKIRRLGRYQQEKVRPIRVAFQNKADALSILKQKNKLGDQAGTGVYIKADQTLKQRNYLNALIVELESRMTAGEKNLKIKYVNSVPKIIKINQSAERKN